MTWFLNNYTNERWAWSNALTPEECDDIIKIGESFNLSDAVLSNNNIDYTVRKSKTSWIDSEEYSWIYEKCSASISYINQQFFNYDLTYIQNLQFTKYESDGGHYGKHIDTSHTSVGNSRKLSFSILLSDPDSYLGGDLAMHYGPTPNYGKRVRGVMTAFPSWMLHEVEPVTSGVRYSLVGWCCGPQFK
jgi:PKHD-type hydroxylase